MSRQIQATESNTNRFAASPQSAQRNTSHWTLDDIEWHRIDHSLVRNDAIMRYIVTAASFIETGSDLYTANLVKHFPDVAAQHWLESHWQPEELQHGHALRKYIETVWPELDWENNYHGFLAEYSQLCTMEELEPSRALEMAARCVVETGTSSFYATLQLFSKEPVLKTLAGLIRRDEVSHYNHFRHFFKSYQEKERIGRIGVTRSLYKRLTEVENEDAYIGLKHAWQMHHPNESFTQEQYKRIFHDIRRILAGYYPYRTALKMLLQPLSLNRSLVKYSLPLLEHAARRVMFRSH